MADPKPPPTAHARQMTGAPTAAQGPSSRVQAALPVLLQASVDAFGDVVAALLSDLGQASDGMRDLSWLAPTRGLLGDEARYQAAATQLLWWDHTLARLPCPPLLSDQRAAEIERHRRARLRATLQARDQALEDHLLAIEAEVARGDHGPEDITALARVAEAPQPHEWRVDPEAYLSAALAALPDPGPLVPITAQDLDPKHHFAGFTAMEALRRDPELGPRAAALDAAVAQALQQTCGLDAATARAQAPLFTGIFWLALRRALQSGSHQLAVAIRFVASAQSEPITTRFTHELLESWISAVDQLPPPKASLGRRLLGLGPKEPARIEVAAPRQIAGPAPAKRLWKRVKGAIAGEEEP